MNKHIITEKFSLNVISFSLIILLLFTIIFIFCGDWKFSFVLNEEKIAQFGDFVGGVVGTLLAFSASLLYYIALKEQQKDVKTNKEALQKQIEEFSNQVKEQELSRKVYEQQLKSMNVQQFENNFYSYFNIYRSIKQGMDREEHDLFEHILQKLSTNITKTKISSLSHYDIYSLTQSEYSNLFIENRSIYSHYFRAIYRLLKMVDNCNYFTDSEKWMYAKIIRSQLEEKELLLLYYNSHSEYSNKSKILFYKYNFLKHLAPLTKFEIRNRYDIKQEEFLQYNSFYTFLSKHVIEYINYSCDHLDEDIQPKEIENKRINCICTIEIRDELIISVYCQPGFKNLTNFKDVVGHLLFDLIFVSNYQINNESRIKIEKETHPVTKAAIYKYKIDLLHIKKINTDKNDTIK